MTLKGKSLSFWVKIAVVLVAFGLIVRVPVWWYCERTVPFVPGLESVDVVVPAGSSGRAVARLTIHNGIQVNEDIFVAVMRLEGALASIHAGRYRFEHGMSLAEIVSTFKNARVESFQTRLAEGATIWQVRDFVATVPDVVVTTRGMTDEEFLHALGLPEKHPEGLFAPETYRFRSGLTDRELFRAAYREQKRILEREWAARKDGLRLNTPYEALILASIIEKETSKASDRELISSVFHNRLKLGMPLQTDPTIIYGVGKDFSGNLTRKDLRTPGPYNTYLNVGLPPSPIAMPSAASIRAALQPADTNYLYFVARGDGTTHFSTHLREHNQAVERYQKAPARRARLNKMKQPAATKSNQEHG